MSERMQRKVAKGISMAWHRAQKRLPRHEVSAAASTVELVAREVSRALELEGRDGSEFVSLCFERRCLGCDSDLVSTVSGYCPICDIVRGL